MGKKKKVYSVSLLLGKLKLFYFETISIRKLLQLKSVKIVIIAP